MTTQNALPPEEQTHTLRVIEGGNAQLCLLSLGCLSILEWRAPTVVFWVGREERNAAQLRLIITAYEIIEPPYNVSMKAIFETDRGMLRLGSRFNEEKGFVFTNYNTRSRKGWVQVPKYYLPQILEHLKRK